MNTLKAPSPDTEIGTILKKHVTTTTTGLIFGSAMTFEEWIKSYTFYFTLYNKSEWMLGDCLNHGEKYGEKYAQAVEITGKEFSTLQNIASVCGRIDISRRRESLPFSFHAAVAYLPPQTADEILVRAERENWNREDIRNAVARLNGKPTKAEKEQAKQITPATTKAAKNASKPPTIDVQAQVTPAKPQPAAPAPAAPTPESPKPEQPPSTPEDIAAWHLGAFNEAASKIDWKAMRPLQKKTWQHRLIVADELIDLLTK